MGNLGGPSLTLMQLSLQDCPLEGCVVTERIVISDSEDALQGGTKCSLPVHCTSSASFMESRVRDLSAGTL